MHNLESVHALIEKIHVHVSSVSIAFDAAIINICEKFSLFLGPES